MAKKTDGSIEAPKVRRVSDRRKTKKSAGIPAEAPDRGGISLRAGRATTAQARVPTIEQVQQLAYEIFLERGGGHGRDVEDWIEAERRLRG